MLTPIGLDPAHPFPRVLNKSLNFVVELSGKDAFGRESGVAIVQAPRVLPRVIGCRARSPGADHDFVFLSSVLHAHVGELFAGMRGRRLLSVPRHAQQRPVRRRGGGEESAHGAAGRAAAAAASATRCGSRSRTNCPPQMAEFLLQQFGLATTTSTASTGRSTWCG